jgi:hypothetical protein
MDNDCEYWSNSYVLDGETERILRKLQVHCLETRTYAATLMVLLLAVRARSVSLLVFEAPPQDGLVRLVPALPRIRAFHCFPTYVPLTFHHLLHAE